MRNFWAAVFLILSFEAMAAEPALQGPLETLLTEKIIFTGPNCFNSALRLLGVQNQRRHLTESEMDFILKTSCRRTDPKAGATLGILRSPLDGKLLHGFVPLEGGQVFTKNGLSKRAKNELQSEQQMISIHTSAAKKVCPSEKNDCTPLIVEFYSCGPISSFPLEDLMTEAQASRETAFSLDFQKLFETEFEQLLAQDLSGHACETRRQVIPSLILSWTLINYASITPQEVASVEQLVSRMSAQAIPPCRP